MIHSSELQEKNIIQVTYPLPEEVLRALDVQDWKTIDESFLKAERTGGALYEFLQNYLKFESIEHIIAIRQAPDDEDGIWHDDGSRILGFTISLTRNPEALTGGHLRFKNKVEKDFQAFTTRPLGEMLLFKTGIYGFEHMVTAVTSGKRIIIAGWCS